MSSEPIKTPSRRRLLIIGVVALAIAGAIVVNGLIDRTYAHRELIKWTDKQAIPTVALAKLQQGDADGTLTLPGTIQPYYKASIFGRVSGYLKSWQEDIGAHVTAGQVLATVDTPDLDQQLIQGKADLATAQANEQLAALTARRWHALALTQSVAQQAADEKAGDAAAKKAMVDAAQANVGRLEAMESFKSIVAPFDGVVTARNTDIGALINAGASAGQALFEVSDLHRVRIYVQVAQALSADLHPGIKATFEMPQFPGQKFDATVVTMSNQMQANSRSMMVELQTDNPDGKFFAGAYCLVNFQLPGDPNMVRVPATALLPVNSGAQVAIVGSDNKVVLKPIQIGRDLGDSVEVVSGLSPSDRVIDSPPETLQNGDVVQLAAPPPQVSQASSPAPTSKAD